MIVSFDTIKDNNLIYGRYPFPVVLAEVIISIKPDKSYFHSTGIYTTLSESVVTDSISSI
jgi:hypothetical protein